MSVTTFYSYDLISCGSHPSILKLTASSNNPHPLDGQVVYIDVSYGLVSAFDQQQYTYTLTPRSGTFNNWLPSLGAANLTSCADPNNDKMYRIVNCNDLKDIRIVLFPVAQTVGHVINLTGECDCYRVDQLMCTYEETATVATDYGLDDCATCLGQMAANVCTFSEKTIGYAVKIRDLQPEPPDRGFEECCYSNLVFGNLSDPNNKYHNDFTSVYYQKQTPNDTVTFEIIGALSGTTALVDGTHGVEYSFSATHPNPDLTYFRVSWHDILNTLAEDTYTIRMNISIAGLPAQAVDSNSFILKAWSINRADNTTRIDCNMDGTLESSGTDFKGSDFDTSLRVSGYFGNPTDDVEQKNVVFSSKKGLSYYESQITMSNDPSYVFQADNIPECISRQLREFFIFGNEFFISDYNLNNHSYRYELTPVILDTIEGNDYPVQGRGVNIRMTFKNRSKNNRKNNC